MMSMFLEYNYNVGNLLLVAISIDRVLLVSMNYSKYVKMTSKLRLKVLIGFCFLLCFMASVFELSMWNYTKKTNEIAASINFTRSCFYPSRRMKWFGTYLSVCFYFLPLFCVGIFSIIFVKRLLIRLQKDIRIAPVSQITDTNVGRAKETQQGEISDPSATDEPDHVASKKRYIKPAITLAALVSAMGISMLPYCTYLLIMAVSGGFSGTVTANMYLVLQLNPLLDPLFFAATQKGIREFYGGKIRAMFRTFMQP